MFDKKTANQRIFAFAVLALSLIFSILFTVIVNSYYEQDVQFFKYGAVFPQIVCWLVFLVSAAIIAKGFLDKAANGYKSNYNKSTPLAVFGSVFTGLIMLVTAVNECIAFITPSESQMIENIVNSSSENAAPFDLRIPIIIFTFISAAYFLLQPFVKKIKPLGIVFIVRMALYIVQGYFSKLSPLNSPVRILEQMSCIAIMIYFVYEVRFIVSEDRPKHYLTFAPAAIFITAVSSVSQICGSFSGIFSYDGHTFNAILRFALLMYMISRYLPYVLSGKYGPVPEPVKTVKNEKTEKETEDTSKTEE